MAGEPLGLTRAFGAVGLDAADLLGDRCGDEAEHGRAFLHRALDAGLPVIEPRSFTAGELVPAVRAPARVRVAPAVLPRVDAAQQPSARGDDLRRLGDELAVELDLVEGLADPERQVRGTAGMDAAAARVH